MSALIRRAKTIDRRTLLAMRGDPGLFGFIGKAIRGVANVATGGLSETVIGGVSSILKGKSQTPTARVLSSQPFVPSQTPPVYITQGQMAPQGPGFSVPPGGGSTFIGAKGPFGIQVGYQQTRGMTAGAQITAPQQTAAQGGMPPSGYHWNKTGYWTSQGYVAPGTKLVKNRRRNPLNPRAASRAISRLKSAKRAVKALQAVSIRSSCPAR